MCTHGNNVLAVDQFACTTSGPDSVPLLKGYRQGNANATFLFSFFQFILEAQSPQLPSKEDTSSVGKGAGAAEVTLGCHIGVYCTGHKTDRDKLPISHLLLMARQVLAITHIRMQVVTHDEIVRPKGDDLCP